MRPLQPVAFGLLLLALRSGTRWDVFADPIGWLLVLGGLALLPDRLRSTSLRPVALLALAVSVPLWIPDVADALGREDPSLGWAADLPGFAFLALLFQSLSGAAAQHGERRLGAGLRALVTATLVVAALPVLVFGAGWSGAGEPADLAAALLHLGSVAVILFCAGRTWAQVPIVESPADRPDSS